MMDNITSVYPHDHHRYMDNHSATTITTLQNGSTTPIFDPMDLYLGIQVQIYVSPILVVLGTLGNALSFLVLSQKKMRATAMYNFLMVLAVADTLVLWFSCLRSWIKIISGFEILHTSSAACKTITFLFLSSSYLSSWLIVLMTIDRFVAVWFPLEVQSLWSIKQARLAALSIVCACLISNLHVFWTFGRFYTSRGWKCTFDHDLPFMYHGFDYLKLILYCFVPFLIVITVNLLIIYRLNRSPSIFGEDNNSALHRCCQPDGYFGQGRDRVCILLLTVSITWLCLMLPYSMIRFISFLHDTILVRMICFMLMYANHSINFFLYCLTGKRFREELKALVRKMKCQRRVFHHFNAARASGRTEIVTDGTSLRTIRHYDLNGHTESETPLTATPSKV